MTLLGKRIAVAVPNTLLEERDSLRDRTYKIGLVARACAIYGVDLVEIFGGETSRGEGALIAKLLRYLETPQYLRRRLFPLDEDLKFAGALPPLRIPSHRPKVEMEALVTGEVREGFVNADGTVDVGLDSPAKSRVALRPGSRATVRVASRSPFVVDPIRREDVTGYWGYEVETRTSEEVFSDRRFDLKLATSKKGEALGELFPSLRGAARGSKGIMLVFGSPSKGLFELVGEETVRKASYVLNLFPDQHVETVRTEEALFASLGLVSDILAEKA